MFLPDHTGGARVVGAGVSVWFILALVWNRLYTSRVSIIVSSDRIVTTTITGEESVHQTSDIVELRYDDPPSLARSYGSITFADGKRFAFRGMISDYDGLVQHLLSVSPSFVKRRHHGL